MKDHTGYESFITSPLLAQLFFHEFPFFTLYANVSQAHFFETFVLLFCL